METDDNMEQTKEVTQPTEYSNAIKIHPNPVAEN
jgi:hypothetical protein